MCEIYCDFRFNEFVSNISDKQLSNKNLLTLISKFRLFLRKYRYWRKDKYLISCHPYIDPVHTVPKVIQQQTRKSYNYLV